MPVFNYFCASCDAKQKRILSPEEGLKDQECPNCGALLVRTFKAPTVRVMETLDNGLMSKSVERLADAERLTEDHAKAKDKE